eukprot:CCRYP_005021-RB/>CCRYP_005021-RB protein AED:0.38 eAED:1.00 QI:0/0/0/1/0/0/2/0/228
MADGQLAQSALMSVACRMDLANTSLRCSCPLPTINNPTSGTRMPSKLSSTGHPSPLAPSSSPATPQQCIPTLKHNRLSPTSPNTCGTKQEGLSLTMIRNPSLKLSTLSSKTILLPSTQMKNYGTTFKRTCKSGTGLNGPVNPSPHLLTLWISPSPLQGPASRPPSTRNHKTYIYTSHPTHHTLVASKRASSLVRFSASDASAQSKRTPTPTSNNSFNAYANEDTTPPH